MFFIESSGQIFHYYKLQTCHQSQRLEKASEKIHSHQMCVGQLRNLHTPIGSVTSLYYSHSLGEFIPGLLSHLSLSLSSKDSPPHLRPPGCFFFPKNCLIFRRSTTNSQLNACTFSAGGPNCGRESLLCCLPLRESNTKLLFPSASSGEETGKIPPSVSLFLFLSLLVSVTFWASHTHHAYAYTHSPTNPL